MSDDPPEPSPESLLEVVGGVTGPELIQLLKLLLDHVTTGDAVAERGYVLDAEGRRYDTVTVRAPQAALDATNRWALVVRRYRTFDANSRQVYEVQLVDRDATHRTGDAVG